LTELILGTINYRVLWFLLHNGIDNAQRASKNVVRIALSMEQANRPALKYLKYQIKIVLKKPISWKQKYLL